MNSQTYMLLGWLSILTSGVIYSLERLTSAIVFVGVNVSDDVSILVHFDIPEEVLYERVIKSKRSTNILRGAYSNFEEVLFSQQSGSMNKNVVDPEEGEADYLFVVRDNKDVDSVIKEIVHIAGCFDSSSS